MESGNEFIKFIQTWIIISISLTYTFFLSKLVSPGKLRFLFLFPIISLLFLLPLRLTSVHFGASTAFFIGWLATFKLVLFSFNKGPLSSHPTISLLPFIATASLPIKITASSILDSNPSHKSSFYADPDARIPIWSPAIKYAVKAVLLAVVFKLYDFKDRLHPTALMFLYCFHIYFFLEFILAVVGAAARAGLGMELEPQFNEPYLTTSLSDFWGRRWNLVVTSILRPSVYLPIIGLTSGPMGRNQAQCIATLATFGVSAFMHEYMMFHLNRMYPTGRMSAFFLLHGVCVVVETAVARRMNGKWKVPRFVSSGLTICFVFATVLWLFLPEFLQGKLDVRAFEEYAVLGEFVESVTNGDIFRSFNGIESIQHFVRQVIST